MKDLSPSIRHLRDLVAIPSVNPMGRDDLPAEIVGEQAIARTGASTPPTAPRIAVLETVGSIVVGEV